MESNYLRSTQEAGTGFEQLTVTHKKVLHFQAWCDLILESGGKFEKRYIVGSISERGTVGSIINSKENGNFMYQTQLHIWMFTWTSTSDSPYP